jgi:hypothetical protein
MSSNRQIEAAYARNLSVQRSRLASMPEVGIFWFVDNKLVADSIPWRQADVNGGSFWTTLQRLLPQWKSKEYTDFPRGRVLFDSMDEVFLAATKFVADFHYENAIPPMLDKGFDGSHA